MVVGFHPTVYCLSPSETRSTPTSDVAAKIREGMIIVRILDGIVKNKYSGDPGKLAAWFSASHVEKAPKKKAPLTP